MAVTIEQQIVAREELKKLQTMLTDLVCKEFALGEAERETVETGIFGYDESPVIAKMFGRPALEDFFEEGEGEMIEYIRPLENLFRDVTNMVIMNGEMIDARLEFAVATGIAVGLTDEEIEYVRHRKAQIDQTDEYAPITEEEAHQFVVDTMLQTYRENPEAFSNEQKAKIEAYIGRPLDAPVKGQVEQRGLLSDAKELLDDFIEDREAKSASSSPDTYILGMGIRDIAIKDEWDRCAFEAWYEMLKKCYGKGNNGNYRVCKSWLLFSNFRAFFKNKRGFRLYILDRCYEFNENSVAIVPKPLARLLNVDKDKLLKGISQVRRDKEGNIIDYRVMINFNGERINIGYFSTEPEAIAAYLKAKYGCLIEEMQFWLSEGLIADRDFTKIMYNLQQRYSQN